MAEDLIGATLRAERLRQGKDLALIVAETKICLPILEALENDQFDCIPSGAYRRSFLRQYARALEMDEEGAVAAFRHQYDEQPVALPAPQKTRPFRHLKEAAYLLLAASGLVGLYRVAERGHPEPKYSAIVPIPAPAAPERPEPAATGVSEGDRSAAVHVAFTVTEPVWVSVKCDGAQSYAGTLAAAENRTFDASDSIIVLIGNAGGLTISLNGRPVGPIGAHGEILLLELTPNGTRRLPHPQVPPITDGSAPGA